MKNPIPDPYNLPLNLPIPLDCGECDHLVGMPLPDVQLTSTEGNNRNLGKLTGGAILFIYPATGVPGKDPIPGWDAIPGAPGCTVQSLGFGERYEQFRQLGYEVFGISAQQTVEQLKFKQRNALSLIFLSDPGFALRDKLGLPTFQAYGQLFYQRVVLVVENSAIRKVFYPVFPPDQSAEKVLAWMESNS